jgi:hypothetical protein
MAKRLEHGIQIGVIRWKELQKNQHPPLNNLFAIPNGAIQKTPQSSVNKIIQGSIPWPLLNKKDNNERHT